MANVKISALPIATELQGGELFAIVQNGTTKQTTLNHIDNYLIPTNLTVQPDITINLSDTLYQDSILLRLTWEGSNGTQILNLPSASENENRIIRIISNGGYNTSTRTELTPIGGDTLDGSTAAYVINKAYEGIQVWSDGQQWFIIQKKA
jgi:ADP-dependent phosphofructokinase/glucokinase